LIIDKVAKKELNLSTDKIKGNFGEMLAAYKLKTVIVKIGEKEGLLKRLSVDVVVALDQKIKKGIDAVYEFSSPPPKYIINEVKYGTADLKWNADKTIKQMDERWIRKNLLDAVNDEDLFYDILKNYKSVLTRLNKKAKN